MIGSERVRNWWWWRRQHPHETPTAGRKVCGIHLLLWVYIVCLSEEKYKEGNYLHLILIRLLLCDVRLKLTLLTRDLQLFYWPHRTGVHHPSHRWTELRLYSSEIRTHDHSRTPIGELSSLLICGISYLPANQTFEGTIFHKSSTNNHTRMLCSNSEKFLRRLMKFRVGPRVWEMSVGKVSGKFIATDGVLIRDSCKVSRFSLESWFDLDLCPWIYRVTLRGQFGMSAYALLGAPQCQRQRQV